MSFSDTFVEVDGCKTHLRRAGKGEPHHQEMRFGNFLVMCQLGTLPADLTRKNQKL